MKLYSWNVNGLRAIAQKDFFKDVRALDPDIMCLQETKAGGEIVEEISSELEGYSIFTAEAVKKGYSGTAILTREEPVRIVDNMEMLEEDEEGRIIALEFPDYFLVNVYVPNSGQGLKRLDYREAWDKKFLQFLQGLRKKKPVILCGDLNVAHRPIDLKNDKANYNKTAGYTQVEIDGMERLLNDGFVDTYRHLYPDKEKYSYWSYRFGARKRNVGWRIDYFLISDVLLPKLKSAEIDNTIMGSDHCPVFIELKD